MDPHGGQLKKLLIGLCIRVEVRHHNFSEVYPMNDIASYSWSFNAVVVNWSTSIFWRFVRCTSLVLVIISLHYSTNSCMLYLFQVNFYLHAGSYSKNVRNAKLRHQSADALLNRVCNKLSEIDHQELKQLGLPEALELAAKCGTVEVIWVCFQFIPEMIWDAIAILENAVKHRREKVVNLLNKAGARNKMLANMTTDNKNLLRWTAELAPLPQLQSVPGSAFQLQRELQWFKVFLLYLCLLMCLASAAFR
jgi:hypothetical protein